MAAHLGDLTISVRWHPSSLTVPWVGESPVIREFVTADMSWL